MVTHRVECFRDIYSTQANCATVRDIVIYNTSDCVDSMRRAQPVFNLQETLYELFCFRQSPGIYFQRCNPITSNYLAICVTVNRFCHVMI